MEKTFIDKIQSRGYWRVNYRPLVDKEKLTLVQCRDTASENSVSLRGWSYPHIPMRRDADTALEAGLNYYQGWVDWSEHKEFWRLYQSGQFLSYNGLREDWYDEADAMWKTNELEEIRPGEKLNVIGSVIYQITEFYVFLDRLTQTGLYDEGAQVFISLHNCSNRDLWIADIMRGPFMQRHTSAADEILFEGSYSKEQLVGNAKPISAEVIKFFFVRFGWHNPSDDVISGDQDKLLHGLI